LSVPIMLEGSLMQSSRHLFTRNGNSLSDCDCSTNSKVHCSMHKYEYEVYTMEETWEMNPLDGLDIDAHSCTCDEEGGPCFIQYSFSQSPVRTPIKQSPDQDVRSHVSPVQAQLSGEINSFATNCKESDDDNPPAVAKHVRPSKHLRGKFRRLVDRLKQNVREEPEHFDVDNMALPTYVAKSTRSVARLKSMVGHYRHQVLQEIAVPDLDARQVQADLMLGRSRGI